MLRISAAGATSFEGKGGVEKTEGIGQDVLDG